MNRLYLQFYNQISAIICVSPISISVYLRKHGDPIAKAKEAVWPLHFLHTVSTPRIQVAS